MDKTPKDEAEAPEEQSPPAKGDAEKLTTMVAGLCKLQNRVKDMTEKIKDMIEMNRSGMATATRICEFQERLDQLQFLLTQDLYKTGEVARCQHRLINDIESFKDILKCEEKKLKKICADMPPEAVESKSTPYVSPRASSGRNNSQPAAPIPPSNCPPEPLQLPCCQSQQVPTKPPTGFVNNLDSMEDSNVKLSDLYISELNPMGKFIKISNGSSMKALDIGGYALCQQTEDGSFFYMFRFPLRTCLMPCAELKIWSACYDPGLCKSPCDFVALGIMRWAVCPDVITKLTDNCDNMICWIEGAGPSNTPGC